MISSRLQKRVRALKLNSIEEYCRLITSDQGKSELPNFLSALTTNVSHFFREEHHFQSLRNDVSIQLLNKVSSGQEVRIWSAGCSNGQELYSIAITLLEKSEKFLSPLVKLLGTDIDPNVVSAATRGIYSQSQAKGIPDSILKKYFKSDNNGHHHVSEKLKSLTTFKELNLISGWPFKRKFDVIFCRNVVIYFDEKTQDELWKKFQLHMNIGGWLFLGHSERIQNLSNLNLKNAGITTYRLDHSADSKH